MGGDTMLWLVLGVALALSALERFAFRPRRPEGAPEPVWVPYIAGTLPLFCVLVLFKTFIGSPYNIPSLSMSPTLESGDYIWVNKVAYGLRFFGYRLTATDPTLPQRGDVVVFRYPVDPSQSYIKRVVGLPGDRLVYEHKVLYINGRPAVKLPEDDYTPAKADHPLQRYRETLGKQVHSVLNDPEQPAFVTMILHHPKEDLCEYLQTGIRCTVPPGHYFVMGDNRDDSYDSRTWGFVPDHMLEGQATFVAFNFKSRNRLGLPL